MLFLKRWLTPPVFRDEEKTHRAYLLHIILLTLIAIPIPFVIYQLIQKPEETNRALAIVTLAEVFNVSLFVLLKRGYVRQASIAHIATLWLIFAVSSVTSSGIYGVAYMLGNGLVITIAGILLGVRSALAMTLLAIAQGGMMVYAELNGWIPPDILDDPLSTWVVIVVLFAVGMSLQNLSAREVHTALNRANASEERYRLISLVSSDYTFSTELDSDGTMHLSWVAGAFENITGFTFEEYVASGGWLAHLHPDDVEKDAHDTATIKTNKQVVTEIRTFKKNGDLSWVRVYAHPVWDEKLNKLAGIVGAVQEITQQKQSEIAITQERDLLQTFMDNIPDLVYMKDIKSRFTRINKAHARFLKLDSPEDAIGKSDLDFQPPDLAGQFMEEEQQLLESGQPVVNRIEFNPTEDGTPRWLAATKVPVKDSHGHPIGIIGITRDVTQQKLEEEHGQRRRDLLEKTVRLGQRITEVYDLRTTLMRIWHGVHDDLGFDRLGIRLYNPERKSMDGTFGTNNQGEMIDEWSTWISLEQDNPKSRSLLHVLEKPDNISFTHNFENDYNTPVGQNMAGVKDHAAIAAWAGEKPVAIISVDHRITNRPITQEQLEALRLFAGYAGLAIENARLKDAIENELLEQKQTEETEQRRRLMLEKVIRLGKQVTLVSDLRTTLINIWKGVRYDLDFDRVGLFLYNSQDNTMDGAYGTDQDGKIWDAWHVRVGWGDNDLFEKSMVFHKVLDRPDGFYYTEDYENEFDVPPDNPMSGVKYYAVVAVWAGNKPVAIISVDQLITGRSFSDEQLEALRLFAGYAGLAISNAKLNDALEDELEQRQTFIDELEAKNAELERFTYTVSHDLKSPLVTITGFLGYLEKDALSGNKEKIKGSVNRISRAAEKMQELLNDLLELSRIGRLMNPPENMSFEEIVNEAVEQVQGQLDEKNVLLKIQNNLPGIHGDRARLVEVMQNLIDNAAKYSNPNSQPIIEIGTKEDEHHNIMYFVRDNGIGIDPQFHERIFGLFNKLNPHSEGTGIGLSLIKRIIEVHNGKIWVESEMGKGSTFYFTLPKA